MPVKYSGNIAPGMKEALSNLPNLFGMRSIAHPGFGDSIISGLVVTEASVQPKAEEPLEEEGRVVCEITVTEDMLNGGGNIHGGCSAFLINVCSTLSLMVYKPGMHVSQSLMYGRSASPLYCLYITDMVGRGKGRCGASSSSSILLYSLYFG
ncbi:hypothetical protein C8F04DRAFT_1031509, partial [Mycena alexandri]